MAKKQQEYGNDSIRQLKGADRVRKRPAVIFGSDGVEGCAHSIFEIISNSIDEARDGHGNRINVLPRQLRSLEGLICQRVDRLNVLPRGDLRHHAAVKLVDLDLRSDAVGQNFTSITHDGDGSFVAGGFHR